MKRLISMIFVCLLICTTGCGASETKQDKSAPESIQSAEIIILDEYPKYELLSYSTYDVDEIAAYFIEDYDEYQEQIEFNIDVIGQDNYYLKTKDGEYRWSELEKDHMCDFFKLTGTLSDTEFEEEKQKVLEYMESLDTDLRCDLVEEKGNYIHHEFRQYINGVKVSPHSRVYYFTQIWVDIGKTMGFSIEMCGLIDEVEVIESYDSKDFVGIEDVLNRARKYRIELENILGRKTTDVEIQLKKAEVAYFPKEENGKTVLIPVYELAVEEIVNGIHWDAVYTTDVFTGYIYDRRGEFLI